MSTRGNYLKAMKAAKKSPVARAKAFAVKANKNAYKLQSRMK